MAFGLYALAHKNHEKFDVTQITTLTALPLYGLFHNC